jgi:hypothetical protein
MSADNVSLCFCVAGGADTRGEKTEHQWHSSRQTRADAFGRIIYRAVTVIGVDEVRRLKERNTRLKIFLIEKNKNGIK